MPRIEMYTKFMCPYCIRASKLLKQKGVDFTEIPAWADKAKRAEMRERSGGRNTFPQIFINDRHIGGCDDLFALDAAGELDPLLSA